VSTTTRRSSWLKTTACVCRYVRHHQQKIVLFLAAMRQYADELRKDGRALRYHRLDDPSTDDSYEAKLQGAARQTKCRRIVMYEIEDKFESLAATWMASRG